MARPKGENHHAAKLTEKLVQEMRYLYWVKGITARCCAKLFDVNPQTAYDAVNYASWKDVEDIFGQDEVKRVI